MKRLALTVLLSGCGGGGLGSLLNQTLGPDCTSTRVSADGLAVVGRETAVRLSLETRCTRSFAPRDTTVEVTVTGPSGEVVEHSTSAVTQHFDTFTDATVTFTPTSAGAWTVTGRFPKAGEVRVVQRAIAPRTEPAVVVTWDEIRRCQWFSYTSHGTLSCLTQTDGRGLEVRSQRGDVLTGSRLRRVATCCGC